MGLQSRPEQNRRRVRSTVPGPDLRDHTEPLVSCKTQAVRGRMGESPGQTLRVCAGKRFPKLTSSVWGPQAEITTSAYSWLVSTACEGRGAPEHLAHSPSTRASSAPWRPLWERHRGHNPGRHLDARAEDNSPGPQLLVPGRSHTDVPGHEDLAGE